MDNLIYWQDLLHATGFYDERGAVFSCCVDKHLKLLFQVSILVFAWEYKMPNYLVTSIFCLNREKYSE